MHLSHLLSSMCLSIRYSCLNKAFIQQLQTRPYKLVSKQISILYENRSWHHHILKVARFALFECVHKAEEVVKSPSAVYFIRKVLIKKNTVIEQAQHLQECTCFIILFEDITLFST